jgi:uncharacterized protein (DUF1786 family)
MPVVDYTEGVDSVQIADYIVVVVDLLVAAAAPLVVDTLAEPLVVVDWGIGHVEEEVMALPIVADYHNVHKTGCHTQLAHRNWGRNSSAAYIYYTIKM